MKRGFLLFLLLVIVSYVFVYYTPYGVKYQPIVNRTIETTYNKTIILVHSILGDVNISSSSISSDEYINLQMTNTVVNKNINCNSKLVRYNIDYALKCYLDSQERSKVSYISMRLRSNDTVQTVWNVLEFIDKNIKYDNEKEKLLPIEYTVYPDGRVVIEHGEEAYIQKPIETIEKGKGICTDYTILTLALLLNLNFTPVYAIELEGSNDGHIVPVVNVSGWLFVLDQHLPPMDLDAFIQTYKGDYNRIYIFKIWMENGSTQIRKYVMPISEFKKQYYIASQTDMDELSRLINVKIGDTMNIKIDKNLELYVDKPSLNFKYNKVIIRKILISDLYIKYNPIFEKQYVNYLYDLIINSTYQGVSVNDLLSNAKGVYVKLEGVGNDIEVKVYIGE